MEENQKEEYNQPVLLFKKYSLIRNIGGGAFGTVFLGLNVRTRENVAIKIEERKPPKSSLENEAYILFTLKGPGLPEFITFGKTKRYNILIESLLGRSLYQIFDDFDKKFTLKDACMIAIQILERLEYIHSKNYIHRDIKPHNFLVSPKNEGLIYIIDFGLAKKYKSDRGNHVRFAVTKHITGTPRFSSINAMRGVEQSRRDDLESLSYLILYFLMGSLPWQGLKIASRTQRFKEITRLKKTLNIDKICQNFPPEINLFCKYTRKLGFTENPKYEFMTNLFKSILNKYGFTNDKKFSWINKENNINLDCFKSLHVHKNSPHRRLMEKLRNSLREKQKSKGKEKENNNDYTLHTIFIDNKNNTSDISELNKKQGEYGTKMLIQSNDNNILIKNNIVQLNIENAKRSYNYPLVVYNNKLQNNNNNNDFNKIANTFKSNDTNVLQQNELLNLPDKISMINATQSNLINMQFSKDNDIILSGKDNEKNINQSKGIKIHDYIRQEEKEGGVIDKDYDYRENDFFKINKPVYPTEQSEQENEINNNKMQFSMSQKGINNNMNENNIMNIKTDTSHNYLNMKHKNNINNNSNIYKNNIYSDERRININMNNIIHNKISISPKGITVNRNNKLLNPDINGNKNHSFRIQKSNINLNNNLKQNNIAPKRLQPKIKDNTHNTNQKNTDVKRKKYIKKYQNNIDLNSYKNNYNLNYTSYNQQGQNLRGSRLINTNKNINMSNYLESYHCKDINSNLNKKTKINELFRMNKTKFDGSDIKVQPKNITLNNIKKNKRNLAINIETENYHSNNNKTNLVNQFNYDDKNNSHRLLTDSDNISHQRINKNIKNLNNNKNQKIIRLKQNNYSNKNINTNINKEMNDSNNIIINNLIIKNNCDNLYYKNNINNIKRKQSMRNNITQNSENVFMISQNPFHNQTPKIMKRNNVRKEINYLAQPK